MTKVLPDYAELLNWGQYHVPAPNSLLEESGLHDRDTEGNSEFIVEKVKQAYELKMAHEEPELLDMLERHIILSGIDKLWQEHLYNMDALREGVHLRAQGQKDPLVEYKKRSLLAIHHSDGQYRRRDTQQSLPLHDQP